MKRDIKADTKTQEPSSMKVKPVTPGKRAKMMVDGATVEKTIAVKKTAGTVFEETKNDLIVYPGRVQSGQAAELKPLLKSSKKTVTDARVPLMEPLKPKKACAPYVFFATVHSAMLRKEKNYSVVEAMKGAGVAWNALDEAGKKQYVEMAAKDALRFKRQIEEVKEKGFFVLDDGSKSCDHMVKVKKDKSAGCLKVKEHGTQTDKITIASDLDYAGALRLARALQPKQAGVIGTPDSKAATKADIKAAVEKVESVKAKATSPPKTPKQAPKQMKAKDQATKPPQSTTTPKKAKAEVSVPDAVKAKKTLAKGRSETPAKK